MTFFNANLSFIHEIDYSYSVAIELFVMIAGQESTFRGTKTFNGLDSFTTKT